MFCRSEYTVLMKWASKIPEGSRQTVVGTAREWLESLGWQESVPYKWKHEMIPNEMEWNRMDLRTIKKQKELHAHVIRETRRRQQWNRPSQRRDTKWWKSGMPLRKTNANTDARRRSS